MDDQPVGAAASGCTSLSACYAAAALASPPATVTVG
jgi:hypothetical protein